MALYRTRGQVSVIENYDFGPQPTSAALAASSVYTTRVRPQFDKLVTTLQLYIVTNIAGNIDAAILDITTGARLAGPAAPVAIAASGTWQDITLATPFLMLNSKEYDLAVSADQAITVFRVSGVAAANARNYRAMRRASYYSTGIPDPATGLAADVAMVYIGAF